MVRRLVLAGLVTLFVAAGLGNSPHSAQASDPVLGSGESPAHQPKGDYPPDPTPEPSPKPDCTPKATPTPEPTCTPKETPTATPTPVCVYRLRTIKVGDGNQSAKDIRKGLEALGPSCMSKLVDEALALCAVALKGESNRWLDQCVYGAYISGRSYFGGNKKIQDELEEVIAKSPIDDKFVCTKTDEGNCTEGHVTIDGGCNATDAPPPGAEVCNEENVKYYSSPISLIWEKGFDIDSRYSYVQFPLNPDSDRTWHSWKASAETPLLVYDPEHRGDIRSAEQLFGEWTFGGKRLASLDMPRATSAWRDGFEALGSIDADRDGKVGGDELKPLALWFDNNRDGISQQGEVRTLAEAGVTALYYKSDRTDSATKSITADRGYERVVNGKTITGASVDWYGSGALTQGELVASDALASLMTMPLSTERSDRQPAGGAASLVSNGVAGMWIWSMSAKERAFGVLTFAEHDGGKITGHSFVEGTIEGASRAAGVMKFLSISGKKSIGADNSLQLEFTVGGPGSPVSSVAEISDDGRTMNGTTEVVSLERGRSVKISYRWTAKKVD